MRTPLLGVHVEGVWESLNNRGTLQMAMGTVRVVLTNNRRGILQKAMWDGRVIIVNINRGILRKAMGANRVIIANRVTT